MQPSDRPVIVADDVGLTYRLSNSGSAYLLPFFGKGVDVEALKGVSFVIRRGESVGILGRNGSGKSSLLSILSGQIAPTFGEVFVSSTPSLLSVSAALQGDLTGRVNARLGLLAQGITRQESRRRAEDIGEWTELGEAFDRPLKTYSSGMKARLKFAIATETASEILMVDEALSTGDSTFAIKARERMANFLGDSGTVIVVSHSASTIRKQCDRVIWINSGVMVADGAVGEIAPIYEKWNKLRARKRIDEAGALLDRTIAEFGQPEVHTFGSSS